VDVLDSLPSVLPAAGGASILLVIIGVLARFWLTAESRHAAEIKRIKDSRDAEHAELRKRVDELTEQYDAERKRRWAAEDAAAKARRRIGEFDAG
jgi:outer membrane murein-binding lipoprotein Lpp